MPASCPTFFCLIILSICGRIIRPNGVLITVSGRFAMWSGMPLPIKNVAKSLEKLLQLCVQRSYAYIDQS